jgi:hypothetical protein
MSALKYIKENYPEIVMISLSVLITASLAYEVIKDVTPISDFNCAENEYCSREGVEKSSCYIDRVCAVGQYDKLLEAEMIRGCRLFGKFGSSDHYCLTQSKKISTDEVNKN